jgi:hypothetical protein
MTKRTKHGAAAPYEVGYGKPPKATQFRKGESGNPRGRPKGQRNFATELRDALSETVVVTEHGKRKRLTKRTVICRQLANRSASGDLAALRLLLPLLAQAEAAEASATTSDAPFDPELERTLTRALFARLASIQETSEEENRS